MGRGDPLPVAVSLRNIGYVGRGGFCIRVSACSGNEGDKAAHCCNCHQEECEVFHRGSSIRPAFYSNAIGFSSVVCLDSLFSAVDQRPKRDTPSRVRTRPVTSDTPSAECYHFLPDRIPCELGPPFSSS